jgi:regulator of cell morphogenesis and NO signaling
MIENVYKKKIYDIVENNYTHASVLYHFGIHFYDVADKTLEEVCRQRGLNIHLVVNKLEGLYKNKPANKNISFVQYPVNMVIEYLKHTHHLFIRYKLPYMLRLIEQLNINKFADKQLAQDLQLVFPLFVHDFIRHIHEEEDTLFAYISKLDKARHGITNMAELYYQMEKFSIHHFAVDHHNEDDEMNGIREITNQYCIAPDADLHMRVIYSELQAFEEALRVHAGIEDEILFPKAMRLENEVRTIMSKKIALN